MEDATNEFTARAYQIDLLEIALKQNTIVYLPTGAGKTFIAVMLIKELSADIRKPWSEGGKRTLFVVNTVPLVIQQCEYIARLTGLTCGAFSGEMGIDFWSESEWLIHLQENQVLVLTGQILADAIAHGYVSLNKINLIIFDECHRAVNDHPMRQIMRNFQNYSEEQCPKVLGLSASLLNSNVKVDKVESIIQSLETTFHAKIATVDSALQIRNYYAIPRETIVRFDEYIIPEIGKRIECIINEVDEIISSILLKSSLKHVQSSKEFRPKSVNTKLSSILRDIREQFSHAGIYGASKSVLLHLIQLECIKKYMDDTETLYVLEYLITELTRFRKLLEDEMKDVSEVEKIHKYSSDQIRKLFAVLKNFYANKSDDQKFCCIIFVRERFTAKVIYQILKNLSTHDETYKFIHPEFLVGFSNNPYKNPKEVLCISKWNKEALHRFRNGLSNCIVATDVIDEGIDVPTCTLIVGYHVPTNIRAYVQSKGRARFANSQYTLLLKSSNVDYLKRYEEFKKTELYLQQLLVGKTCYRQQPTKDEIEKELYTCTIEPYSVVDTNGVKSSITEQSAISLINMYCAQLLNSKFVYLAPIWILHKSNKDVSDNSNSSYKVSLKLPIVSPLKNEVIGDPMISINDAKRSAAMKTCIELHKIGELSDRLVPNTADSITKNMDYLFPNWINEDKSELIGTYKKKRRHKLQFPSALYGAFPIPNKPMFLHLLHAKPVYSAPHDDNRHLVFYNLLCSKASFGILSSTKMPQIPAFPLFMNVGQLNVNVEVNYAEMNLSESEIGSIKLFHTLIFNEIVPVIKPFMVFDNYNLDNCFLIVPIDEQGKINWEVVKQYKQINRVSPEAPFDINSNDYELSLVVPNYRASADVYIVTEVCEDLTPGSCFPTDNFLTYAHYYKEKHDLDINNLKQPMLEVKPISGKINCIKPRSMSTALKRRKIADSGKELKEHLVPELCIRLMFPALYYLKATMLPSILHRISQFLIAEDLRYTIAVEAHLGSLSTDNKWPPLTITDVEKEESFEPSVEMCIDENIENLQYEPILNGPEIDVLNTEAYHYPWTKDQEPPDMYRNIEEIQMIQIEHYCQFMSGTCSQNSNAMQNKKNNISRPSITGPPLKILSLKNSRGPDPTQIMYALTSVLGRDAFNLERLETLGDSYLKFLTSLFLYNMFPKYNEGSLTILKGKIIGNRNLYYCGNAKLIPGRMKIDDFDPFSNFIAPAYTTFRQLQSLLLSEEISPNVLYEIQIPKEEQYSGRISESTKNLMQEKVSNWESAELQTGMEHHLGMQTVADKTVADSVEALIGVYLTSMGIEDAANLIKWFTILPDSINISTLLYGEPENPLISEGNVNKLMPWASDIETRLNYKFNNQAFLLQAFTHPSYSVNNMTECYQRLEFLGDAILDFIITCYIYENCGNLDPGALTDLRSALVNNITFACLAVRYGLHTALLAFAPILNDAIDRFVKFQEERKHVVNDELLWILLEEDECNMAEYVDVPKVLGDIFESTIGAIYLDCNKDLVKVWEIIYSLMYKELDEFSKNIPKQPIRVLYETQGACPLFSKTIKVEDTNSVMVPLKVNIAGKTKIFHGFGANKKQAKCAAAKQALKSLLYKT
ncbi:endoribonuclease Dcr-2 [Calliopsis andreniformis]|uniref:endoribonuclease Dcr-2 n=1 Tax=Calliopsis andreniformis TaxID=337506 RepID=UPI003FCE56C8